MSYKYSDDFSDVMVEKPEIEQTESIEFDFDEGKWCLKRERNHWEIQFMSEKGEESIIVEREDFENGKIKFDIDGEAFELTLETFDGIEKFAMENRLI